MATTKEEPLKTRLAIAAAALAAASVVPAAPAQAQTHDCKILGPAYVAEVVDCVIFIYETAIG